MAGAAVAADLDKGDKRVLVAVDPHLDEPLGLAGGVALAPERTARARPVMDHAGRRASPGAPPRSYGRPSARRRARRRPSRRSPGRPRRISAGRRTLFRSGAVASWIRSWSARAAQQIDEAGLLVRIVAENAGELRRDGRDAVLAHAAHRHAGVLGLDHHRDPARGERILDRLAICADNASWVCRRRANMSTMRASFERPTTPRAGNSRYGPCRRTARYGARNAKRTRCRAPSRDRCSRTPHETRATAFRRRSRDSRRTVPHTPSPPGAACRRALRDPDRRLPRRSSVRTAASASSRLGFAGFGRADSAFNFTSSSISVPRQQLARLGPDFEASISASRAPI